MLQLSSFGLKDGVQQDRTALMLLLCAASGTYLELQIDHECSCRGRLRDRASVRSQVFAMYTDVLGSA